jgi:hypothetical protein
VWRNSLEFTIAAKHGVKRLTVVPRYAYAAALTGANPGTRNHRGSISAVSARAPITSHFGAPNREGVYHSIYDDPVWFEKFADPGLVYGAALPR